MAVLDRFAICIDHIAERTNNVAETCFIQLADHSPFKVKSRFVEIQHSITAGYAIRGKPNSPA
jgi:hypothetical protein